MFLQHPVARGRTMSSNQIVEGFEFCYLIGLWSCCCCNRNLQEQKCKRVQVWEWDWEPTQVDISRNVAKLHHKHLVALTRTTHPSTNCMVLFYVLLFCTQLHKLCLRIRNRIINQYGKKSSLIPTLRLENHADVSTEYFSLHHLHFVPDCIIYAIKYKTACT